MHDCLRCPLDRLGARIAGDPDPGPDAGCSVDGSSECELGGDPRSVEPTRASLLRGAAVLTGRGDLAQDAVHVALARARLSGHGRTQLCADVLALARHLRVGDPPSPSGEPGNPRT